MNEEKRNVTELFPTEGVEKGVSAFHSMELYVENEKKNFQELHGCNDSFEVVTELGKEVLAVNGFRGIVRVTVLDDNNQISEITEYNYFERLNSMLLGGTEDEVRGVERAEVTVLPKYSTKSPDPFSITVYGGGNYDPGYKYRIILSNWYFTKTFHKKDYWDTGATHGFYNCLKNVNLAVTTIVNTVGFTVLNKVCGKLIPLLQNGKLPSQDAIVSIIIDVASALGITIAAPVTLAVSFVLYCTEVNRAQYFWNQIF